MSGYYAFKETVISSHSGNVRWVITDYCKSTGKSGITIEYQEKVDGLPVTMSSIHMGKESAELLIKALNEIEVIDVND